MTDAIAQQKKQLRLQFRERLRQLPPQERLAASSQAGHILQQQPIWTQAQSILFYSPLPDELDLSPLWEIACNQGKSIALPRFIPRQNGYQAFLIPHWKTPLACGKFGVLEPGEDCSPVPLNHLDLVLVPGLAFDLRGRRLGRGKGFYDRLLASVTGATCGMAWDFQILHEIPVEPHDVVLNCIVTPTRSINPRAARK